MDAKQKQRAVAIFEANPQFLKLWMNPKGEFFSNENLAKNSLTEGEKLESITNTIEVMTPDVPAEPNVKEMLEIIGAEDAVPQLEQMLINESEGKNRKSVMEALEKKNYQTNRITRKWQILKELIFKKGK